MSGSEGVSEKVDADQVTNEDQLSDKSPNNHDDDEATEDSDQYEERFRVDRRKLEQMLHGEHVGPKTAAENFFLEVMEDTNTSITWPSKLKIGAKSKKDPHIKVSGDPENVKKAKEKIMAVLDTKSNRVTLKMDVSHTEHSHVIGKGGNNIKKVMESTGCHIHFPDSNRSNQSDKSNQVSIAGQPYGVECARMRIRELLPISFAFEVPLTNVMALDSNSPVIARLQQQYGVTVTFKQRPRNLSVAVIVRGTGLNVKAVKEATIMLQEHVTGSVGTLLSVSLHLEVASQHHLFMIGRGGSNIQQIMAKTGATICFPDVASMMTPGKGTIYVSGTIDSVLAARESIIGCLPLVLMFDMKEDIECDQSFVNSLMEKLDVFISIKPKPKQPSKSVIVKSIEDNALKVYEARRQLLGIDKEEMPPRSTWNSYISSSLQGVLLNNRINVAVAGHTSPVLVINRHVSPLASPRQQSHITGQINPSWLSAAHGVPNPSVMATSVPPPDRATALQADCRQSSPLMTNGQTKISHANASESSRSSSNPGVIGTLGRPTDQHVTSFFSADVPASPLHFTSGVPTTSLPLTNDSSNTTTSSCSTHQHLSPNNATQSVAASAAAAVAAAQRQKMELDLLTKTLKHDLNLSSSGAQLIEPIGQKLKLHSSGSGSGLRALHQRAQQCNDSRSPQHSQRSFSLSMSLNSSQGMTGGDNSRRTDASLDMKAPGIERLADRMLNQERLMASAHDRLMSSHHDRLLTSSGRLASVKPPPGLGQPSMNAAGVAAALADYERKKVMASRAIEQEPSGETRNPTDFWSGLGFSQSMPESVIRDRLKQNNIKYDGPNMATTYEQQESEEDGDPWKTSTLQNGSTPSTDQPGNILDKFNELSLSTSLGRRDKQVEPPSSSPQLLSSTGWSSTESKSGPSENSEVADLFRKLGLEKYTELFQQQEIDLATFATLDDQDLKELGINTFGARRKMLLAIAELQKSKPKHFSPVPGSNNPFRLTAAADGPFPKRISTITQSGRW